MGTNSRVEKVPTFSFVSLAYRTEPYVADMIESVIAQTRSDWELVVVDNGMSDEVARIVGRYSHDPRIVLVRQENRGVGGGVAAGVGASCGRYLSILHSDDQVVPDFCARLGAVLDRRQDIDALGCDALMFDDADSTVLTRTFREGTWARRPRKEVAHRVTTAEVIAGRQPYYTGAIRREAWDRVGGYAACLPGVEDMDLWLRLLATEHIVWFIPDRLGWYRAMPQSISHGSGFVESVKRTEILLTEFGGTSERAEDRIAVDSSLSRLRYLRDLEHARDALLAGDAARARMHAAGAFGHVASLRAGVVWAGLAVAPGLLTRVHPLKQRVMVVAERLRNRWVGGGADAAPTRTHPKRVTG